MCGIVESLPWLQDHSPIGIVQCSFGGKAEGGIACATLNLLSEKVIRPFWPSGVVHSHHTNDENHSCGRMKHKAFIFIARWSPRWMDFPFLVGVRSSWGLLPRAAASPTPTSRA